MLSFSPFPTPIIFYRILLLHLFDLQFSLPSRPVPFRSRLSFYPSASFSSPSTFIFFVRFYFFVIFSSYSQVCAMEEFAMVQNKLGTTVSL